MWTQLIVQQPVMSARASINLIKAIKMPAISSRHAFDGALEWKLSRDKVRSAGLPVRVGNSSVFLKTLTHKPVFGVACDLSRWNSIAKASSARRGSGILIRTRPKGVNDMPVQGEKS